MTTATATGVVDAAPGHSDLDSIGLHNVDLAVERKRDKLEYDWGEDDDHTGHPRVRRQPDWFYDWDGERPLKRGSADQLHNWPKDDEPNVWKLSGGIYEGQDWTACPITSKQHAQIRDAWQQWGIDPEKVGIPPAYVPEERWSQVQIRCSVCRSVVVKRGINDDGGKLPALDDKVLYCSSACRRAAKAAGKKRKYWRDKGIRKYPRDDMGRYVNQYSPDRGASAAWVNVIPVMDDDSEWLIRRDLVPVRRQIMRGVERRPMKLPDWWEQTVKLINAA